MRLWGLNREQERILLYLLDLDGTPTKDVPADLRLTARGIAEGTQLSVTSIAEQLKKLVENAFVRPLPVDFNFIYVLTAKGRNYMRFQVGKRRQKKWFKLKLDKGGSQLELGRSETRGTGDG
jgi:DNA-binding MarR family transcriptional regulator